MDSFRVAKEVVCIAVGFVTHFASKLFTKNLFAGSAHLKTFNLNDFTKSKEIVRDLRKFVRYHEITA